MFDFMDEIVEGIESFAEDCGEWAICAAEMLLKFALVITAPAWVLPYKALRS